MNWILAIGMMLSTAIWAQSPQYLLQTSCSDELLIKAKRIKSRPLTAESSPREILNHNFVSEVQRANSCDHLFKIAKAYAEIEDIVDHADANSLQYRLAYHPLSLEAVNEVREDFGALKLPVQTDEWVKYSADKTPWAGYWFPARRISTLIGRNSPLAKLEKFARMHGRSHDILTFERQTYAGERWESWDGHCHAWAMASVMFDEPQSAKGFRTRRGRVSFSIADQKAILTKIAENANHKVYGVRFGLGEPNLADSYADFQDIRPEAFHTVVVERLKKGLPTLIDDDPKQAVWTKPVFSFAYKTKQDPEYENAILVEAQYVAMREYGRFSDSNQLTNTQQGRRYKIEYRLFHNGEANENGEFEILRGEWIGDSRDRHPDVVIVPGDTPRSFNENLNENMDLIQENFISTD